MSMPGDFESLFGTHFPKKEEKGIPWKAKEIDYVYYVPLDQVAELLKQNGVLPKVQKGIEIRCESLRLKKEMGL